MSPWRSPLLLSPLVAFFIACQPTGWVELSVSTHELSSTKNIDRYTVSISGTGGPAKVHEVSRSDGGWPRSLPDVPAGSSLNVVVRAFDGEGTLLHEGRAEGVTVEASESTLLDIVLYEAHETPPGFIAAHDAEGDTLSFSWVPSTGSLDSSTESTSRWLNSTPLEDIMSRQPEFVTATVSDSRGASTWLAFNLATIIGPGGMVLGTQFNQRPT